MAAPPLVGAVGPLAFGRPLELEDDRHGFGKRSASPVRPWPPLGRVVRSQNVKHAQVMNCLHQQISMADFVIFCMGVAGVLHARRSRRSVGCDGCERLEAARDPRSVSS